MDAPEDLPAAHSMDTEWFAIDALGHVGTFDSGEGGGLPLAHFELWHEQSVWETLLAELCEVLPPGTLPFFDDGVFEERGRYDWDRVDVVEDPEAIDTSWTWGESVLVELRDAEQLRALDLDALGEQLGGARPHVLATARPLLWIEACTRAALARSWSKVGIRRARLRYTLAPARVGVFVYDNDSYDGHPYVRVAEPVGPPLLVPELPTAVRRRLAQVRFERADFGRDGQIQPFEHVPSTIWGTQWIGTDGAVHPANDE